MLVQYLLIIKRLISCYNTGTSPAWLAAAHQSSSVKLLLVHGGISHPLRCNCVSQVTPELRSVTLEALAMATPPGQKAAALRNQAAKATGATAGQIWQQAAALDDNATAMVLAGAEVVAATCIGAGKAQPICNSLSLNTSIN